MLNFHLLLFGAVGVFFIVLTIVIVNRTTVALSSLKINEDNFVLAHEVDTDLQKNDSCNVCSYNAKYFRRIVLWIAYVVWRYVVPSTVTTPATFFPFCNTKGAGRAITKPMLGHVLQPFLVSRLMSSSIDLHGFYVYVECRLEDEINLQMVCDNSWVTCDIPFPSLQAWLTVPELRKYAFLHGLRYCHSRSTKKELLPVLKDHLLECRCVNVIALFRRLQLPNIEKNVQTPPPPLFPPQPLSRKLLMQIVRDFCDEFSRERVEEMGCAVCGQLCVKSHLVDFNRNQFNVSLLCSRLTRCERLSFSDPVQTLSDPVLAPGCSQVCVACKSSLDNGTLPRMALANGLWIGEIPDVLRHLSFAEKLLIARIRHNRCLIKVASGRCKMIANAVMLSNPTPDIYRVLPPSRNDLEELLAIIFIGPSPPTDHDLKRTPLLVRRNKVKTALQWLRLNHCDYSDIIISDENLQQYPESGVPVEIISKVVDAEGNILSSELSMHDLDVEKGTTTGPCPFTVNGVVGTAYESTTPQALKAIALRHLEARGKILAIGHERDAVSMYDNPQAYPQMFPWLFPYGFGGIGQRIHKGTLSESAHKRYLLLYYDKRFQTDPYFPMVAFNHKQIKSAVTGSFLTASRSNFSSVVQRLQKINPDCLIKIISQLTESQSERPVSEDEKLCYGLLRDIDHIGGFVSGSVSSKKTMRSEAWSLMMFSGSPNWFVTLSPADNRHPLCIYYAGEDIEFRPEVKLPAEREALIASNPVAAARFFHLLIQAFLKHVLGVNNDHDGLFGKTAAYYGCVEQQGRLTLHLHLLIWVENSLSPQEIRQKLLTAEDVFRRRLIEYLEACHTGDFLTGSMEDMQARYNTGDCAQNDPTLVLPEPPPSHASQHSIVDIQSCTSCNDWWLHFANTVDHLLFKCNVHRCFGLRQPKSTVKGCVDKYGICRARFPRPLFEHTVIDEQNGHIDLKKREPMLNTVSSVITYLFACNTDVSSLLSGSAVKAVLGYVTDYITKQSLKTHQIFQIAYDVLMQPTSSQIATNEARKLILKIVNALTTKMDTGSPLACLYLLDNPDHYCSHSFVNFAWKRYIDHVMSTWNDGINNAGFVSPPLKTSQVVLSHNEAGYSALTPVDDYRYRPSAYENVSLYEWIQCATKIKRNRSEFAQFRRNVIAYCSELGLQAVPDLEDYIQNEGDDEDDYTQSDRPALNLTLVVDMLKKSFMPDHPLFLSHRVVFTASRKKTHVPNFVGGKLPRKTDMDDDMYYCTMLSFFHPWRTGRELKKNDETWYSAFHRHTFSQRELQIMKNCNLRYECYDARDAFSSQLNQQRTQKLLPDDMMMIDRGLETMEMHDDPDEFNGDENDPEPLDLEAGVETRESEIVYVQQQTVVLTDRMLTKAGFYNTNNNYPTVPSNVSGYEIPLQLSSNHWNNVLKVEKDEVDNKRESVLAAGNKATSNDHNSNPSDFNGVKIIDKNYFSRTFRYAHASEESNVCRIIADYSLNNAQERAFRIAINHLLSSSDEQLRMYIGGMAGTGKSRVLHALKSFFADCRQSYRMIILAPTGTAAALVHGFTYHSALNINTGARHSEIPQNEHTALRQVRTRLQGVTHVFIDEISMIACHELYAISSRLSLVTGVSDRPFGGLNVILAGDFAQLPPAKGAPLYSASVSMVNTARQSIRDQSNTMGKLLWHQFTTVVILRENMRQREITTDDCILRTALENIRYAACTATDIAFLRSRVASLNPLLPDLSDSRFRNVSIITSLNIQKDRINENGCKRFAQDTHQMLTNFYSVDSLSKGKSLTPAQQLKLWRLPPTDTDHIAGVLSLCKGMPVIIRYNYATQLCITRGQEAHVVSWTASDSPVGLKTLDTLFVELDHPPTEINIPGLPKNVVPLTKMSTKVVIKPTPGITAGHVLHRQQVHVLPNFAMTDFSGQGKNRNKNPINIANCRSHTAIYTALSRTTTASGTLILCDFDNRKLTSGMNPSLRQEFRELELLDLISQEIFNNLLPYKPNLEMRYPLLRQFQLYKGPNFQPDWHPMLRWEDSESRISFPRVDDELLWCGANFLKERQFMIPLPTQTNNKLNDNQTIERRFVFPIGPRWDATNWSCAYDSCLAIICNIWHENPVRMALLLSQSSPILSLAVDCFHKNEQLDDIRDRIRATLHAEAPDLFPLGQVSTDIYSVARAFVRKQQDIEQTIILCSVCNTASHAIFYNITEYTHVFCQSSCQFTLDVEYVLQRRLAGYIFCNSCRTETIGVPIEQHNHEWPNLLVVALDPHTFLYINPQLELEKAHFLQQYKLKGVIYYANNHFTCSFITDDQESWLIDGQRETVREEIAAPLDRDDKHAVIAVYVTTD